MEKDKVYFARKYGLAERDIAPEFLPLLIAFDDVNEQNRELADKIRGGMVTNTHEHYYEGMTPLSALLLRWGWVPPLFFLLITGACLAYLFSSDRTQLQRLESVVQYNDSTSTYRISAGKYKLVKEAGFKGIYLIVP